MEEEGNPPVVTLVEPDDPNIGDPYVYGAERIFRCIGADISEHDAGIAFVPDTVSGCPYGTGRCTERQWIRRELLDLERLRHAARCGISDR